ncbi:hypothetical protein Tco_0054998 [Tanacetum coccineum]
MILSGIGNVMYSTVDACTSAKEMNANPLALVAATQHYLDDTHYQALKPHKIHAPSTRQTLSTRYYATTRNKGKEIVKPITAPYESAFEEYSDPEQS